MKYAHAHTLICSTLSNEEISIWNMNLKMEIALPLHVDIFKGRRDIATLFLYLIT